MSDRKSVPGWPAGVRIIGLEDLNRLGIDDRDQLHWDGRPIEIRRPLALSFWQRVGAVLAVLSAVIAAGAAVVSACADVASIS